MQSKAKIKNLNVEKIGELLFKVTLFLKNISNFYIIIIFSHLLKKVKCIILCISMI